MKISNWRQAIAAALLSCGIWVPAAPAADLQTNLVSNPGFEMVDLNDPGPFTSVRILDWVDADGDDDDNFAYPYSSAYSGDPAPPGSGDYHFTGGFDTSTGDATITQTFDVSAGATGTAIATGNARYDLRGFFTSYFTQTDASFVRARFLDANANELQSATIGGTDFLDGLPVLGGQSFWGQDAMTGTIPVGTASVTVDVVADGGAGNFDGYVDQLDFRVGGLPNDVAVSLRIDPTTGEATLRNLTGSAVDLNYYEVSSASSSLDPNGWNSLQDQNLAGFPAGNGTGNGWEESGGASTSILAENYLLGSSTLDAGGQAGLGSLFGVGMSEDLVFRYGLDSGLLLHGVVEYLSSPTGSCDLVGTTGCDIADLDALVAAVVAGSTDLTFDLNGDGQVTAADITDANAGWLRLAGEENLGPGRSYLVGDADLNGIVDGQDFITWNANKFSNSGLWSQADFTADGATDGQDFIAWNGNKFTSADLTAVPEPGLGFSCLLAMVTFY